MDLRDRVIQLEGELDKANRLATDRLYMMQAYKNMLGPVGLQVVNMWREKGVKRVHFDWGPQASLMTGEERAQFILDMESLPSYPIENIDDL